MPFVNSLRTKVLLSAFVPLALVLVVVGVIALRSYESEAGKVVRQRDTELAQLSAARLSEELARNRQILQIIADDEEIQSLEPSRIGRALERIQTQLFVFDAGVVIYDTDGVAIWSDPFSFRRRGLRFPNPDAFDNASATLGPSFSNVFRDEISGKDVILLTVPIVARGPEFKGAVVGMYTLDSLPLNPTYREVLEITGDSGHFAYVVDANGRVILHRNRSWLGTDLSAVVPVAQATKGETGAVIADGPEGEPVISGFAPVPETGWVVITQESWSDVIGPIRGYSRLLLGLLAAGGVVSGALLLLSIGRILKPMRDLAVGAHRIAGGDFDQPIVADTGDEVQALAEQFNTMAGALKQSYESLEQRVADRTEELRVTEERYRTLFEQSYDAIFINRAGVIIDVNQAALDLFGGPRETVLGHDVGEFFMEQADRVRMREELTENEGFVKDFSARIRKRDGTEMDCLITARRRAFGDVEGVEGTIRDVTEWKRTEEELFEQARDLAVLDERNRMAREIHDTLAQGFTGIVLQLEAGQQALGEQQPDAAEHMERAKTLARESLQEARRSVWDLLPQPLEQTSLTDALRGEVERFASRGTEKADFEVTGEPIATSSEIDAAMLRICQEALMNVRKYAQATRVEVTLGYADDTVTLSVRDDGAGFEPGDAPASDRETGGGFGLTSMRQRARLLGGTLDVKSTRAEGTEITAAIRVREGGYTTLLTR